MTRQDLTVGILEADDAVTVCVAGDIDIANSHVLAGALGGVLEHDPPPATVYADLGGVSFLDSAGLSALMDTYHAAQARGSRFKLSALSPPAQRVLEITGLLPLLSGD